ncbi:hypothetical protein PFISCL1PPCAC_8821, partial [Pristionchus fissidentatus]
EWRAKAFQLSSTNRIGNLLTRSIEVMQTAVRNGLPSEKTKFLLASLERDQKLSMEYDNKRNDLLHEFSYAFCVGLRASIESIIDKQPNFSPLDYSEQQPLCVLQNGVRSRNA